MWWCYILRDNKVSISYLLWFDPITGESFLITSSMVFLKRRNNEPILTLKIIEWRRFIDYLGLSIEADPARVRKKNPYFSHIGSTPMPSSGHLHILRHQPDKELKLEPPKLRLYQQTNKNC